MNLNLNAQQLTIVRFVERFRREHPMGPSLEEIAAEIRRTKSPAWYHVKTLLRLGVLCAEHDTSERIREGSLHVAQEYAALATSKYTLKD